jgi:uncharacterized membrane protein YfcA
MITDPLFYATAIPAVLIIGISKAGFGSAFGSLAVPLMALTITVPMATAILLPVLFVMDALGLRAYWGQADWKMLRLILPAGLVGIVLGWFFFNQVDPKYLGALVGITAIGFVGLRSWQARKSKSAGGAPPYKAPDWVGRVCAVGSGFTSFIAHAGGPPMSIYTIPQKLNPVTFAATMTVFFACINLAKWIPYQTLGLLSWEHMTTSLVLIPLGALGNYLGLRLAKTINPAIFYKIVTCALLASGTKLIYDALK